MKGLPPMQPTRPLAAVIAQVRGHVNERSTYIDLLAVVHQVAEAAIDDYLHDTAAKGELHQLWDAVLDRYVEITLSSNEGG